MSGRERRTPARVPTSTYRFQVSKELDLHDFTEVVPIFLTIALMPFTYSITNGIGAGVGTYVLLQVAVGRRRGIHPLMWVIAVLFGVAIVVAPWLVRLTRDLADERAARVREADPAEIAPQRLVAIVLVTAVAASLPGDLAHTGCQVCRLWQRQHQRRDVHLHAGHVA